MGGAGRPQRQQHPVKGQPGLDEAALAAHAQVHWCQSTAQQDGGRNHDAGVTCWSMTSQAPRASMRVCSAKRV